MTRATMTIPEPIARDGDRVLVRVIGVRQDRGRVIEEPRFIYGNHGGWIYRVRFDDGSGFLDVAESDIQQAPPPTDPANAEQDPAIEDRR